MDSSLTEILLAILTAGLRHETILAQTLWLPVSSLPVGSLMGIEVGNKVGEAEEQMKTEKRIPIMFKFEFSSVEMEAQT
jgi:hypothetical protein